MLIRLRSRPLMAISSMECRRHHSRVTQTWCSSSSTAACLWIRVNFKRLNSTDSSTIKTTSTTRWYCHSSLITMSMSRPGLCHQSASAGPPCSRTSLTAIKVVNSSSSCRLLAGTGIWTSTSDSQVIKCRRIVWLEATVTIDSHITLSTTSTLTGLTAPAASRFRCNSRLWPTSQSRMRTQMLQCRCAPCRIMRHIAQSAQTARTGRMGTCRAAR